MSFSRHPAPLTAHAPAYPGHQPSRARGWAPLVARAAAVAVLIGSAIALAPASAMAAPVLDGGADTEGRSSGPAVAEPPEGATVAVTAAVSLRVKDPDLGKPLAGVRIMTVVEDLVAVTDEDGTALIPAHKLTDPVLLLEREGYQLLVVEVEELAARNLVSMVAEHAPAAPKLARPELPDAPVAKAPPPTPVAKAPAPAPVARASAPAPVALAARPTATAPSAPAFAAAPRPHTFRAPASSSRVTFAPVPPDLEAMLPARPAFRAAPSIHPTFGNPAPATLDAPKPLAAKAPPKAAKPLAATATVKPKPHAVARALAVAKAPPPLASAPPAARPPVAKALAARPSAAKALAAKPPVAKALAAKSPVARALAAKSAPAPVRLASIELPPAPRFAVVMPQLAPSPTEAGVYVVRPGDSLAAIARAHLGGERAWHALHDANRAAISNPRLIYPGQRLVLPGRAGPPGQG